MRYGRYQLGLCDRCGMQHRMSELRPDGDQRGLLVCAECRDHKWRELQLRVEQPPTVIRPEQPLE